MPKDVFSQYFSTRPGDWTGPVDKAGAQREIKKMGLDPNKQKGTLKHVFELATIRPAAWCEELNPHEGGQILAVARRSTDEPTIAPLVYFTVASVYGKSGSDGTHVSMEFSNGRDPALSASIFEMKAPRAAQCTIIAHSNENVCAFRVDIPSLRGGTDARVTVYQNGIPGQEVNHPLKKELDTSQLSPGSTQRSIVSIGPVRLEDATCVLDTCFRDQMTGNHSFITFPLSFTPHK